jgi:SAM-dependent methyltransferase
LSFNHGLVVGKFSPLHFGHQKLIDTALASCKRLTILSWSNPEYTGCEGWRREAWLWRYYGEKAYIRVLDPNLCPPNDAPDSVHRAFCAEFLKGSGIDAVFTSEAYGPGFAEALTLAWGYPVAHKAVDPERQQLPISGTSLRSTENRAFLEPELAREFYAAQALVPHRLEPHDLYRAFLEHTQQVPEIMGHLSTVLGKPGRLLDVGCGTGRLFKPFKEAGWEVEGIEADFSYGAWARKQGLRVHSGRLESLRLGQRFDAAILISSPLGYLLSRKERVAALKHLKGALVAGGRLFVDLPDYGWIQEHYHFPKPEKAWIQNKCWRREFRHRIQDGNWVHSEWLFDDTDQCVLQEEFRFAMLSGQELKEELSDAGYQLRECWNSWGGEAVSVPAGPRLLILAESDK